MKFWALDFDLARLFESYGIAILTGGILIAFTQTELKTVSRGFMISGAIFILISAWFRNRGEKKQEFIEDSSK